MLFETYLNKSGRMLLHLMRSTNFCWFFAYPSKLSKLFVSYLFICFFFSMQRTSR